MTRHLILVYILIILSCGSSPDKKNILDKSRNASPFQDAGYDFSNPDEIIILPAILHEISGITAIDNSSIACIQDENGIVFFYDLQSEKISRQINFYGDGDYEGIAFTGSVLYVLRSDGLLLEITNLKSSGKANAISLNSIMGFDNEGLCYDNKNERLLIAPKNKPGKEAGIKGDRAVFGYDLIKREFIKEALYGFDVKSITKFAVENNVYKLKKNKKKNKYELPDLKFRPSSIAIHPLTGRLYIISSADPLLAVFNINGNIEQIIRLDKKIFNMPEGITFLSNGDILVSNEGEKQNATLIRLNYRSK